MKSYPLREVCNVVMGQAPAGSSYNTNGIGLPLLAGAGDFGEMFPSPSKFTDVPTKVSEKGDLILCIRATIGDINWSDKVYCLGRGVAGLRPKPKNLNPKYLWHWIGTSRALLVKNAKGSTFLQIARKDIEELEIPLPATLREQSRIAEILDKADEICRKRRQAIALTDTLLRSTFLDMFGDPMTNHQKWPTVPLGEVGQLDRGVSKHRPRNAPELLGGPYPLVQTGEVTNSGGYITQYTQTYSEQGLHQSKMWPAGTLCITIAANIARTGILTFNACFPDSVVGFKPGPLVRIEYVQHWLSFLQKIIEEKAPVVAQKNINLQILRSLDITLPPIEAQDRFVEIVAKAKHARQHYQAATECDNDLFASLSNLAFSGEL